MRKLALTHAFFPHFQIESYIPQLFTRKFSPREPKCLNRVAVRDSDGLTTREIAPIGAISRLCQNHNGPHNETLCRLSPARNPYLAPGYFSQLQATDLHAHGSWNTAEILP